ncbi:MAG: OmpA family protein, partial [Polyangiaceae bacterium]
MKARGILAVLAALMLAGCTQGAVMRGRLDGLTKIVDEAENNGAKKCAPRELALARSNIVFAQIDLDQGELSNADQHVDVAEVNAHA